jgi:hypothetical protein
MTIRIKTPTGLRGISLVCVPTPLETQDRAIAFYESPGFEKRTDVPMGGVQVPRGTSVLPSSAVELCASRCQMSSRICLASAGRGNPPNRSSSPMAAAKRR